MKTTFQFLAILFFFILFSGCSKTADAPLTEEQRVVNNLTGLGNRYWRLSKVYVNTVEQTLSSDQLKYTKTYTLNPTQTFAGTFVNSDGYSGKWYLNGPRNLIEVILNNMVGPVQVSYILNEISENKLDIEYTANFKTVREVYYAF